MKEFFSFLFEGGEGYICVSRCDVEGNPTRDRYFHFPSELDEVVTYCTKFAHESIYFVPNLLSDKSRRSPDSFYGTCAYGDADLFPVTELKVAPSIVVQTSPEKTHVYWKIEDSTNPVELERLSKAVSLAHPKETTNFDNGYSRVKLLRVPGTTHLKDPKNPYKVNYEITGATYTIAEFAKEYPLPEAGVVIDSKLPENLPTRDEAMQMIKWSVEIDDIITGSYRKDTGRYRALALATHEIFRAGGSNEVAFVLLQDSELNKWAADGIPNASQRLWEDIQRSRSQSELVAPDEAAPLAVVTVPESKYKSVDFLTEEERAQIKPTFVDEFVAWGQSKTRTSPAFHVAAGFTVLSTVFADFHHIELGWKEPLNLWFMPSGRSTTDRKTTVMNQMLSVLRALEIVDRYEYDIGSDFTVSGLSDVLLDSPYRSGVVHVDEFQGFLMELGKNYMAGTKESLTAMYGGNIKGKLRSTGNVKRRPSVPYSLSFYAMGITNQIAENLDREDFLSGFLTRFIYAMPAEDYEPPHILEGFDLPSKDVRAKGDTVFEAMVDRLRATRDSLALPIDPATPTEPIDIEPEAHERIRQFIADSDRAVRDMGKEELVSTTFRLCVSVYKCAALLAMSSGRSKIKVEDVLAAINFAGDWFTNILRMVDMISDSDWMKVQEEIVGVLVANSSTMDAKALYRVFKDKHKPRDYAEIIKALDESGVIQQVTQGKTVTINYIGGSDD